jgi:prepilin-type N-terminal cleavage/methylation domain-containing protein
MNNRPNGFTLIELLVSIVILVMVITAVFASYRLGIRAYRRIETQNFENQNLRQGWRMISRDVRCAFMDQSNNAIQFTGEHSVQNSAASDRVIFVTCLPDGEGASGGLCTVSYYIDTDPATPQAGLVRSNSSFPMTAAATLPATVQEIAPLATSLHLRYYDGVQWRDTWGITATGSLSSSGKTLPSAVELTLTIASSLTNNKERSVTTVVPVFSN